MLAGSNKPRQISTCCSAESKDLFTLSDMHMRYCQPDDLSLTCAKARSQSLVLEYHLFLVLISFQRRSTTNNVLKKATKG
jgi:hypothetical protein